MPTTTFSTENVRQSPTNFPKLKLAKGDSTRIVCAEPGPIFEYAHNLQMPKISPNTGKAIFVKKTRQLRNGEKEEVEDYDFEWVGTPICLGDPDVLQEKGVDPKCPICALSTKDEHIWGPQRKFAIHVLEYNTQPGDSTEVSNPFGVNTRVWTMSEGRYAKVAQILKEEGDGEAADPRTVDLRLGPCESQTFQNYEIHAGRRCEMLLDEDRSRLAALTYQENHAADLSAYCGKRTEEKWIKNDLEKIQERWEELKRGTSKASAPDFGNTLDSTLLDSKPTEQVSSAASTFTPKRADAAPGEGSPLNEFQEGGSKQDTPSATSSSSEDDKPKEKAQSPDLFTNLLAQLGENK